MSTFTRRSFIGKTAVAIGGLAALQKVVGADHPTDPGPANQILDGQNPDSAWPPSTDSKSLVPTFKYPFSFANKRVYDGGWSREVTVRELPISKSMAGVNMRLSAGGVRELHWHTSAEWDVQKTLLHDIENTGDSDLVFLEMFKAACFRSFRSRNGWPTHRRNWSWRI